MFYVKKGQLFVLFKPIMQMKMILWTNDAQRVGQFVEWSGGFGPSLRDPTPDANGRRSGTPLCPISTITATDLRCKLHQPCNRVLRLFGFPITFLRLFTNNAIK